MLVDLVYAGREFGKMLLPRVKTRFNGAHVHFYDQTIQVSDMATWLQLLSDLISNEKLVYQLRNGQANLKGPFGTKAQCGYNKDISVLGMNGLPVVIKDVMDNQEDGTKKVVLTMRNLSTFEIDFGPAVFEIQEGGDSGDDDRHRQWRTIARLKGHFFTKRGEFHVPFGVETVSLDGGETLGLDVEKTYYLKGIETEREGAWTNEAIKFIRSPMVLTQKFISLY